MAMAAASSFSSRPRSRALCDHVEEVHLVFRIGEARARARRPRRWRRTSRRSRAPRAAPWRRDRPRPPGCFACADVLKCASISPSRSSIRSPSALRVREEVRLLLRIFLEVVQLGTRRRDQLVAALPQRAQIAPAEMVQRIDRFGVGLEAHLGARAGHQRGHALAVHRGTRRRRHVKQIEHGRHRCRSTGPDRRRAGCCMSENGARMISGTCDHALVDEEAVAVLAVIVEALAVVADDHDRRCDRRAGDREGTARRGRPARRRTRFPPGTDRPDSGL